MSKEVLQIEDGWISTRDAVKLVEAATGADLGPKLAQWAQADLLPSRCTRVVTIDNAGTTVNRDPSEMGMAAFWRAWSETYRNAWMAGPEANAERAVSEWVLGQFETWENSGRCCAYGMQFHGPSLRELLGLPVATPSARASADGNQAAIEPSETGAGPSEVEAEGEAPTDFDAAPATRIRMSKAESERWYRNRFENWPADQVPPSRAEDEKAGRELGLSRGRVRELRNGIASVWTDSGRRPEAD